MSKQNQTLEILSRLERGAISPRQAEELISSAGIDTLSSLTLNIQGQEAVLRKILEKLNQVFSEVKLV